jgi:hypothetical protein
MTGKSSQSRGPKEQYPQDICSIVEEAKKLACLYIEAMWKGKKISPRTL